MHNIEKVELIIVGGGPAGLSAALAAANYGVNVILVEEREFLGGQLVKQTHRFFGSEKEYAGTRGLKISNLLVKEIKENEHIKVLTSSRVLGIYKDKIVTILTNNKMMKYFPKALILATGASEKFLAFENNDLPGVFGAGAVQTLMNLYGVSPAKKILMVGSGNIGLIVSYQLLQAGVEVACVIEAAPKIGGYSVHASKLRRMGVPILTSHTIKKAVGKDKVEGAIICQLDSSWREIIDTDQFIKCDAICLSVGLTPLTDLLRQTNIKTVYISELGGYIPIRDENMETNIKNLFVAGDVSGIEEATSAIIEGQIAGLNVAKRINKNVKYQLEIEKQIMEAKEELELLRAGPVGEKVRKGLKKIGLNNSKNYDERMSNEEYDISFLMRTGIPSNDNLKMKLPQSEEIFNKGPIAISECFQKFPCDPCVKGCPFDAISEEGNINNLPYVDFEKCTGCAICVSKCPGLAMFVVQKNYTDSTSLVTLPYEFLPKPMKDQTVLVLNREGTEICEGIVKRVIDGKIQDKTTVVTVEVPKEYFLETRNIKVK
ncbi:MAG: FAD-dependent oxidoreductase [Defluviitoga tunisiensis]|jgi:sarcosine oxidase subunit alpha|nr:FAD-dependent oxidoreductase [Defluviitoga tunisiensis]MDY0379387.1 FAD-dependent oxidoreductase [Defluviitoga tunisiensis]HHV01768.1 FAD-dependent oxidoreductase [Defluviitoga tunisiensis]HOK17022.1 FAD-dependent oxidoreductase [Defluviitoga tunisiensis]HOL86902.1 FAD-dependent oxidoreductase [Defluviitoga tunisiensis]